MKTKIEKYVKEWQSRCYSELPDESPPEIRDMVPSYQRIAVAILKNDIQLKTLGFSPPVCESYVVLKRMELSKRPGWVQLRLFM